jgi:transposase
MTKHSRQRLTINEKLAILDEYNLAPRGQRALFCREGTAEGLVDFTTG